jgi:peptidoglycan/xylan/chitin deacetylase (PgdA/CDA1 family)
MLWMNQASLAQCMQLGSSVAAATALSVSVVCAPPRPQPHTAIHTTPKPMVTLAAAHTEEVDLLPAVKPETLPLPEPVPPLDCAVEACLALTFDDGPHAQTTPQLLDVLAAERVQATFFMLGSQAAKHPELVKRVAEEGHEIGNHSWMHGNYTKMTPPQMMEDFMHTQQVLAAAGADEVHLFRPPYGARNDAVRQTLPVSLAIWNIDPEDWRAANPTQLAAKIITSAKPGGVVVLHDIKPITVAAAPQFIKELKNQYRLVTFSQLLNLAPETPKGEFTGR